MADECNPEKVQVPPEDLTMEDTRMLAYQFAEEKKEQMVSVKLQIRL